MFVAFSAQHTEAHTEKLKLENGMPFQAGIWHAGTPEEFLNHVKQAVHACERKWLFSDYATALKAHLKSMKEYKKAVKTLKAAQDNNGNVALIKSHIRLRSGA